MATFWSRVWYGAHNGGRYSRFDSESLSIPRRWPEEDHH